MSPAANPNPQVINTSDPTVQSVVTSTVPANHPNFDKFMKVLAALEPLVLAGVSPFLKSSTAQTIVVNESPVAQTLFQALSNL